MSPMQDCQTPAELRLFAQYLNDLADLREGGEPKAPAKPAAPNKTRVAKGAAGAAAAGGGAPAETPSDPVTPVTPAETPAAAQTETPTAGQIDPEPAETPAAAPVEPAAQTPAAPLAGFEEAHLQTMAMKLAGIITPKPIHDLMAELGVTKLASLDAPGRDTMGNKLVALCRQHSIEPSLP